MCTHVLQGDLVGMVLHLVENEGQTYRSLQVSRELQFVPMCTPSGDIAWAWHIIQEVLRNPPPTTHTLSMIGPFRPGILISPPSAACVKLMAASRWISKPSRLKSGLLLTCAPCQQCPLSPSKLTFSRTYASELLMGTLSVCPSETPAGICTWMVCERVSRPLPPHCRQGVLIIFPCP